MSQAENMKLVHRAVDAWNRRDIEDLLALSDPEIEYVNSPTAVEPGTRRGSDEATAVFRARVPR
jgi:ketosteroid isomerase-like protein